MGEVVHVLTVIDGASEDLIDVLVLKHFDLEQFRKHFDVPDTDPMMLDRYGVSADDAPFLSRIVGQQLTFDFEACAYFVEAAERK